MFDYPTPLVVSSAFFYGCVELGVLLAVELDPDGCDLHGLVNFEPQ